VAKLVNSLRTEIKTDLKIFWSGKNLIDPSDISSGSKYFIGCFFIDRDNNIYGSVNINIRVHTNYIC
jgi:hypothetical protein